MVVNENDGGGCGSGDECLPDDIGHMDDYGYWCWRFQIQHQSSDC